LSSSRSGAIAVKTFFIATMGCNRRLLDCERIKNYLIANQFTQVNSSEHADYIVVSTCGASKFHEDESINLVASAKQSKGKVIVYGCLPAMNVERLKQNSAEAIIPTKEIERFDDIFPDFSVKLADTPDANKQFEESSSRVKGKIKHAINRFDLYFPLKLYNICLVVFERLRRRINLVVPFIFSNPLINRVPLFVASPKNTCFSLRISHGCAGNCSYCNIKKAIGKLRSKPIPQILEELKKGIAESNYKVNIISSDPGSYGVDIGSTLPELLDAIFDLDGRIMIQLIEGLHPVWLCRYEPELIELVKTKRIRTLMIPVQSGSKMILKLMNRSTKNEQFEGIIRALRQASPRIRLATQVILGFPTETEQDFQLTVNMLKRCRFDEVDIFQYYETRSTDSMALTPKIPRDVVLDRIRRLQMNLPLPTITHTLYEGLIKK